MKAADAFKTTTEAPVRLDHEAIFMDKRVIPPFRQQGPRMHGTLHLPGALRAAAAAPTLE